MSRLRYHWAAHKIIREIEDDGCVSVKDAYRVLYLSPPEHEEYWRMIALAAAGGMNFKTKTYPTVLVPSELVEEIEQIFHTGAGAG